MKVCLVFPPFKDDTLYNMPPLGLLNLGAIIENMGHEVRVLDLIMLMRQGKAPLASQLHDWAAKKILEWEPQLIGFSTQCTTYPPSLNIAKRCKTLDPSVVIIFGGHNASFLDVKTLQKFPYVDVIVRGEGELTIKELVHNLEKGKDLSGVKGITYRTMIGQPRQLSYREDADSIIGRTGVSPARGAFANEEIRRNPERELIEDLDSLPLPAYHLVPPLKEYKRVNKMDKITTILDAGRGCYYNCIYCSQSPFWRKKARSRSVPSIIKELEYLKREHGVGRIVISYDLFTAKRSFVEEFCHSLLEKEMDIEWHCICRVDGIDEELLPLMHRAGCTSLCFGVDSGSPNTLTFIRKKIDPSVLYKNIRLTKRNRIVPTLSFVIGFPEETMEDLNLTLELAIRCAIWGDCNPLIQLVTVLPGTDLLKRYLKKLVLRVTTYFSGGIEFDHTKRLEEDQRLIEEDPEIFSSFYNIPTPYLSLDFLDDLTKNLPPILFFYAKSFFVLMKELNLKPTELFYLWKEWLDKKELGNRLKLEEVLKYFKKFSEEIIRGRELTYGYLKDLISYDYTNGKLGREERDYQNIPHPRPLSQWERGRGEGKEDTSIEDLFPRRKKGVYLSTYSYDLKKVIKDLEEGHVIPIPPKETCLITILKGYEMKVMSINPFGKELVDLCDGSKSLKDIVLEMMRKFGSDDFSMIKDACLKGVEFLIEEGVLHFPLLPLGYNNGTQRFSTSENKD